MIVCEGTGCFVDISAFYVGIAQKDVLCDVFKFANGACVTLSNCFCGSSNAPTLGKVFDIASADVMLLNCQIERVNNVGDIDKCNSLGYRNSELRNQLVSRVFTTKKGETGMISPGRSVKVKKLELNATYKITASVKASGKQHSIAYVTVPNDYTQISIDYIVKESIGYESNGKGEFSIINESSYNQVISYSIVRVR